MSYYHQLIIEATGCRASDCEQIEDVMRDTYSTLDKLDRRTFLREARLSWAAVQELRCVGVLEAPTE